MLLLVHTLGFLIALSYVELWRKPYDFYMFFVILPVEGVGAATVRERAWERFAVRKHSQHSAAHQTLREEQ